MNNQVEENLVQSSSATLAGLGESERRILSYAAVMGKEFDFTVLYHAIEMDEEALAEDLESMVHKGILKELEGGDTYVFVRMVTLAQAYSDISASRMRVIHRKVAESYEMLNPEPSPGVVPEMGRHFHLGGMHEKSVLYNRYAASLASRSYSPDTAVQFLERTLEDLAALPGDHRLEESDVLRDLGDLYLATGDSVRADALYVLSFSKLPKEEETLRALVLLSRAQVKFEMDELDAARKYCGEAVQLLERLGHKKGLAMAHRILSRVAFKVDEFEKGREEIQLTLSLLDPREDAREIGRCYIDLANTYSGKDKSTDQGMAIKYYDKAMETLEPLHDYRELWRIHNNIAATMGNDHPAEALEELRKARDYSEMAKDRRGFAWTLFNGVELYLILGEVEKAANDNEEAYTILSKLHDPYAMLQIVLNRGLIAYYRKAYEEAERHYREATKMAEDIGYPGTLAEVHLRLAILYAEWGRERDALEELSRTDAVGADKLVVTITPMYEELKKRLLPRHT
jgi:tetratricopeptide (TPR) repeat protein